VPPPPRPPAPVADPADARAHGNDSFAGGVGYAGVVPPAPRGLSVPSFQDHKEGGVSAAIQQQQERLGRSTGEELAAQDAPQCMEWRAPMGGPRGRATLYGEGQRPGHVANWKQSERCPCSAHAACGTRGWRLAAERCLWRTARTTCPSSLLCTTTEAPKASSPGRKQQGWMWRCDMPSASLGPS